MSSGLMFLVFTFGAALVGALWNPKAREHLPRFKTGTADELVDAEIGAIEGVVVPAPGRPARPAPLSAFPCVYWQLAFHEVGAKDWVERERAHEPGEFFLETARGTARVVVDNARFGGKPHMVVTRVGYAQSADQTDLVIAQARAADVQFAHPSSVLRVVEYVVAPGAKIKVRGFCKREPDPTAAADVSGYREALPTRPVLSGTRRGPLWIALD